MTNRQDEELEPSFDSWENKPFWELRGLSAWLFWIYMVFIAFIAWAQIRDQL